MEARANHGCSGIDVGLHQSGEILERVLPAKIARLYRNHVRQAFLHDVQLGADRYWPERYRYLNFSRQIQVIESVYVVQSLIWDQLDVFAAE